MDQFVSLHAEQERAVLIDCRSLEHRLLPLDTSAVRIVVCNTMVHHELGSSAYNERRASCEAAAKVMRVGQLRDASVEMLQVNRAALDETQFRRARHVVTEDERALEAVGALETGDYRRFGALMNASHDSLRRDYEVSCPELDLMAQLARRQPGCLGARMTGAGFGGCTVNLVERPAAESFGAAVVRDYEKETGVRPALYRFTAVGGARVDRC